MADQIAVTFGQLQNLASGRFPFPSQGITYCYSLHHCYYFGLENSILDYRMIGSKIQSKMYYDEKWSD